MSAPGRRYLFDDAAPKIDAVDADTVCAALVDDLPAALAEGHNLAVQSAHRGVVDRDRSLFGAPHHGPLRGQRELAPRSWPNHHHQAIRANLPRIDFRLRQDDLLVGELKSVITELNDVATLELDGFGNAFAVDVRAVVAGAVFERPDERGVDPQLGVTAREVALDEANARVLGTTDRIFVVRKFQRRSLAFVILDRQLPHD